MISSAEPGLEGKKQGDAVGALQEEVGEGSEVPVNENSRKRKADGDGGVVLTKRLWDSIALKNAGIRRIWGNRRKFGIVIGLHLEDRSDQRNA